MKKQLLLLFLAGAAFSACKKDRKDDGGNGPRITKYLTSVTEKEEDGTTTTQQFTWDAQNRLTAQTSGDGEKRTLTYDAAGRISKLRTEHTGEGTTEEYAFTYTAAGLPEKYTHRAQDDDGLDITTTGTYTITGGKVTKITEKNPDTGDEVYSTFTYSGNNITKIAVATGKNNTPEPGTEQSVTFTYGTKKNPLAGMQLTHLILGTELILEAFSENEPKTLTMKLGPINFTSSTTYQYDAAGYPTSAETREDDSDDVTKVTFQYK